jgi:hypothetical protein
MLNKGIYLDRLLDAVMPFINWLLNISRLKVFLLAICGLSPLLLSGCGSESGGSSAAGEATGLWIGTTTETVSATETELATFLLFHKEDVYILREDEAQIGSYEVEDNGHVAMNTQVFSYDIPDTDNNFYVGDRGSSQITLDSLFATETTIFANYEGSGRSGSLDLELDTAQEDSLSFNRVTGTWGTTDSVLYINDEGGIIGNGTDCQWNGDVSRPVGSFMTLNIWRQGDGCGNFTPPETSPAEGIALIDGEGTLHFLSLYNNVFLWQRFSFQGTNTTDDAAAEEEVATEEVAAEV